MAELFEIRPFEKCIEKVKYTTKVASQDFKQSGRFPIISQEEAFISGYWDSPEDVFHISKPVVIFGDHSRHIKYIDFDFVIGADGVKILSPVDDINAKYFYYYLRWLDVPSLGYSRHFKSLKEKTVKVFPVDKQQRIVSELDLLTDIIDKKNAQLRNLDALAQSIFFEMFGVPSLNDKGWPFKNISDLFDVGSSKRVFESEWRNSGVPFYRAREIVRLSKGEPLEDQIFIEEALFAEYKQRYGVPKAGDIMVTGVGTLGICYLVKDSDRFYFKDGNTLWFKDKGLCNTRFIKDLYSTDFIKEQIKANAHGATVGTYTIVNAKSTRVIVPPIELQNEYVNKILKIDAQKELINESLKQIQHLLDSRMDYYFNE